jgi:hypothetical protein
MAKVQALAESLLLAGPPLIPIYGIRGGSFVKCSKLQLCNFRELMYLMEKEGESMDEKDQYYLYRRLMDFSSSLKEIDFQMIEHTLGFVSSKGGPEKCWNCGGKDFTEENHSYLDRTLCEYDVKCSDCQKTVGSWSHGYWMP